MPQYWITESMTTLSWALLRSRTHSPPAPDRNMLLIVMPVRSRDVVGGADVDQPAVLDLRLHAVLERVDAAQVGRERDVGQLLLPVDGEPVEGVVAVVDAEHPAGAVDDRLVAAGPVLARLRSLDQIGASGVPSRTVCSFSRYTPGARVTACPGSPRSSAGLDGPQGRSRAVVGVGPGRAHVQRGGRARRGRWGGRCRSRSARRRRSGPRTRRRRSGSRRRAARTDGARADFSRGGAPFRRQW